MAPVIAQRVASKTTPVADKTPHQVKVRVFRLTDIPDVMDNKLKWPIAARLMRHWFDAPAWTMPDAIKTGETPLADVPLTHIDESIIKLDWLLQFSRFQQEYERLLNGGWNTEKGRLLLAKRLKAVRPLRSTGTCWQFGNLTQPARLIHAYNQVNLSIVRSDPEGALDEYYGAIGDGQVNIAVAGTVTDNGNKLIILIDQVALYFRDTYDFNDASGVSGLVSQPLGYWGFGGVRGEFGLKPDIEIDNRYVDPGDGDVDRYFAVQNNDFQRYREKYARGGDFLIFSDVKRYQLTAPVKVEINL